MSNELPFFVLDDLALVDCLNNDSCKSMLNDRLSDLGLREYLFKLSKDEYFKALESSYYTTDHFNNKMKRNKKDIELSVFHLNIHSLNSKQRAFCTFIHLLEIEFDVIILSEIWTHNLEFYHNILDGYSLHYDLPNNSMVGGIGMFVKNSLNSKLRPDLHLPTNNQKIENLWIEVTKNRIKYIIGGIYRHPNQKIQDFTVLLESNLAKISKDKTPCIIAGDINIDFLKAETCKDIEMYLNNLIVHNFLPTILLPTRVTNTTSTVIDHIYYYRGRKRKQEPRLSSGNFYSDLSDHLPNFLILSNVNSRVNFSDRPLIRLHTNKNKNNFQNGLQLID